MKKRPHSPLVKALADKTQALKMMSMDMASCGALVGHAAVKHSKEAEKAPAAPPEEEAKK